MTDEELREVFSLAANKALAQWGQLDCEPVDLAQDLWVWYSERPSTQRLMESMHFKSAKVDLALRAAVQLLSKQAYEADIFQGRAVYSSDSVREALRGESTNKYLNQILPHALANLRKRNWEQAEAIRVRYSEGVVPARDSADASRLKRAVRSVTQDVNVMLLTSDDECIGSSSAVFPETRKKQGGYSDPTGDTVIELDEHPEYRFHVYEDTPIRQFLGGAAAQPALNVGKIKGLMARYRRTG